jgi:hypothetical protein
MPGRKHGPAGNTARQEKGNWQEKRPGGFPSGRCLPPALYFCGGVVPGVVVPGVLLVVPLPGAGEVVEPVVPFTPVVLLVLAPVFAFGLELLFVPAAPVVSVVVPEPAVPAAFGVVLVVPEPAVPAAPVVGLVGLMLPFWSVPAVPGVVEVPACPVVLVVLLVPVVVVPLVPA